MGKLLLIFGILFFISFIAGACENGQIDVNSASAEELDEMYGIGPAKAQAIIDARPFDSVDDLMKAYGIGEKTLEAIKQEGLACVADGETQDNNEEKEIENEESEVDREEDEPTENVPITNEAISLNSDSDSEETRNPKNIKTKGDGVISERAAIYVLGGFCVLLGLLFGVRKLKKYRNEFDEDE
jgi:competence ComEA-like helix-hairpin-helix protein